MSETVRAESHSVRDLKRAIFRYSEELRVAITMAKREAASAETDFREAVDQQRVCLRHAESDVRIAQDALSRSSLEDTQQCSRTLCDAQVRALDQARRLESSLSAERRASYALHDLLQVVAHVEATIADQTSTAASALLELDVKLSEITSPHAAAFVKNAVVSLGVAAQVATAAVDLATLAGNVSQGALPTSDRVTSTSQLQDLTTARDANIWAEVELDQRKEKAGDQVKDRNPK